MEVDRPPPVSLPVNLPNHRLVGFCERWKIDEFAFFGSVLRPDFRPDSDIDVMVAFSPTARWSLLDLVRMQQELEELFDRPVNLVERVTIHNPFRKQRIMQSYRVVYASQ